MLCPWQEGGSGANMHEKESKSHPDGHGVDQLSYTSRGFVLSSYVDCTWFFFSNWSRGQTETPSPDNPAAEGIILQYNIIHSCRQHHKNPIIAYKQSHNPTTLCVAGNFNLNFFFRGKFPRQSWPQWKKFGEKGFVSEIQNNKHNKMRFHSARENIGRRGLLALLRR